MPMQAAVTIVASIIHSHYIGLDVTRKHTIHRSEHLPSAVPAGGGINHTKGNALQTIGQVSIAGSKSRAGREVVEQQTEALPACSQPECPSADTSHQPELCRSNDPLMRNNEVEQQVSEGH